MVLYMVNLCCLFYCLQQKTLEQNQYNKVFKDELVQNSKKKKLLVSCNQYVYVKYLGFLYNSLTQQAFRLAHR